MAASLYVRHEDFDILFVKTRRSCCTRKVKRVANHLKKNGFSICLPEDHDAGRRKTDTVTEYIKRSKCLVFLICRHRISREQQYIEDHVIQVALKYKKELLVPMLLDGNVSIPDKFIQFIPLDASKNNSETDLNRIAERFKKTIENIDQSTEAQNYIDEFLDKLTDDGKQYTVDKLLGEGFRPTEQHLYDSPLSSLSISTEEYWGYRSTSSTDQRRHKKSIRNMIILVLLSCIKET